MTDIEPLVSCIIPALNAQDYIRETICSVLGQTYRNLEIIVIDDGSTDKTSEVVVSLQSSTKLPIYLYKNPRKGACAARNYGFVKSRGGFIQFLDADDLLSSSKISSQINLLLTNPGLNVASCMWGKFSKSMNDVQWQNQLINKTYTNPAEWLLESYSGNGMGQTGIWLTPRSLIEAVGPWNENLKLNQDGEFFSRVILSSKGIIYSSQSRVYYRSGLSESITQKNILEREKAESLLESYRRYVINAKEHEQLNLLKPGLGNNFLSFIYLYYDRYEDLAKIAEYEFYQLGFNKPWPVGSKNFRKMVKMIGFHNSLELLKVIRKF